MAAEPKIMFVLNAAAGELFNAMYLVMGCGFRPVFALPDPAYSLNRTSLPGPCYLFDGFMSLLAAIDEEDPELVCLFSGYLYIYDKIIDLDHLEHLVRYLRSRGTTVITSDPFLGLIPRIPVPQIPNPVGEIVSLPFRLLGQVLFGSLPTQLFRAGTILKDLPHMYVVDPDDPGVNALPFYNPHIRDYAWNADDQDIPGAAYWLFILAGEYFHGIKHDGAEPFHTMLRNKLREAAQEGRRVVLIAPAQCIDAVESDESLGDCLFIRRCSYRRFMTLLLRAEYTFYWNIFSASILARMLNSLPTFFFATGHLADVDQRMFEKGMACYYRDARLTYLDPAIPLQLEDLAAHAETQPAELFEPILSHVRDLPTPEAIVRFLLRTSEPRAALSTGILTPA